MIGTWRDGTGSGNDDGGTAMTTTRHLVGLLLGAEEDWPQAFEALTTKLGAFRYRGQQHVLDTERVHIAPFNLRDPARQEIVIAGSPTGTTTRASG